MTDLNETPSATIRRAARDLRTRAEAATEGPWQAVAARWLGETYSAVLAGDGMPEDPSTWLMATGSNEEARKANADYAASVHPLVGLAVASWLDDAAQAWDEGVEWDDALDVARVYLGLTDAHLASSGGAGGGTGEASP